MDCRNFFRHWCIFWLLGEMLVQHVSSEETTSVVTTSAQSSGVNNPTIPAPSPTAIPFRISLGEELLSQTVPERAKFSLNCEITGHPTPHYEWYKDGVKLSNIRGKYSIKNIPWGQRLKVSNTTLADSGVYICTGENLKGKINTSAVITVLEVEATTIPVVPVTTESAEMDLEQPICQDSNTEYCGFLTTEQVYVTSRFDQHNAQKTVTGMVQELKRINVNADSQCFKKSVEASCYYHLPICIKRPGGLPPIPKKLCKHECEAIYDICRDYFLNDDSKWQLLPLCQELDNNAGCISIGLRNQEVITATAINSKDDTKGVKTVGISGLNGVSDMMLLTIALPVILAVLLLIITVVIVACICKRRSKMEGRNSVPSSNSSHGKSVELSSLSDKGGGQAYTVKEVPLDNINRLQELGESSFGKVYHGQVFGLYGSKTASTVFIKCLSENASIEEVTEFRDEVNVTSEIRHQHLLSLLAISTQGITQCILYEHLPLGDLRQFILSQQSRGQALTCKETMYVVTQIASAMEHLSSLHYIHKDIAAHNIIVSHNLNVKLSNLKIVNGVHSANYFLIHNKMLPIRWLPPESITYNKFSFETDIYSFGVLLWEAFSGATQPYVGFTHPEVIQMIRSRQLLECPGACPPRIYSLMMECWHETPSKRPTAKDVNQKMRAWYLDNSYAVSTTTGPSVSHPSASHSGSTCTAPSQHSSIGIPGNNLNANSNHTNLTDVQGSRHTVDESCMKPSYLHSNSVGEAEDTAPYYSTIDSSYAPGQHTASSSSFDNGSEYTVSTNPPQQPLVTKVMPPNFYASTPTHRYASLNRRHNDIDFGTQTTPLVQQTDQV